MDKKNRKRFFKQKKAQVMVFVIIGLVILIGVGVFVYFESNQKSFASKGEELLKTAPDAIKPVIQFVTQCLQDVSIEAFYKLANGGYIDIQNPEYTAKSFVINQIDSTEADVLYLNDKMLVPYWQYMNSKNNCNSCTITDKNIPSIEQIQTQINKYIEKNIAVCLQNLTSFEKKGFLINDKKQLNQNEFKAFTTIAADNIEIIFKYLIKLDKEDKTYSVEEFYAVLPLNFQKIYDLAIITSYGAHKTRYLEKITLSLISAYSGVSNEKLPPFAGVTGSYATSFWLFPIVKEQLQNILTSHIPFITAENTKNSKKISSNNQFDNYFYDQSYLLNNLNFSDLELHFYYFNFPLYLHLSPSNGDIITPNSNSVEPPGGLMPKIQVNSYEFFYDVAFPVLVEIYDQKAFGGKGYRFYIAIEANIKDNRDISTWFNENVIADWDPNKFVKVQEPSANKKNYISGADPKTGKLIENKVNVPVQKLFCDPEQRIGTKTHITVFDTANKLVSNIGISYNCNDYEGCSIGSTNNTGEFSGQLPFCVGGVLRFSNIDYETKNIPFNSTIDGTKNLIITASKLQQKNISFILVSVEKLKQDISNKPSLELDASYIRSIRQMTNLQNSLLQNNFSVTLIFTKESQTAYDEPFTRAVTFKSDEVKEIPLLAGNYTVKGIFILNKELIIAEETRYINAFNKYTIPEVKISSVILGGIELNNETGFWELTEQKLESAKQINFYVFQIKKPEHIEDFNELQLISDYTKNYRIFIEPKFEK